MVQFSRRGLLASMAATPLAFGLPSLGVARATNPPPAFAPVARINIGRFEITFLTDGFLDAPYDIFTGRDAAEIEKAARPYFSKTTTGIRISFTQHLIRDGNWLILVDAGPAGLVGQTGRLIDALARVGVKPEDIDAVIVTHAHFDHMAGLVAGGRANFPNAEIYIDRRDIAHFTDPAKEAAAPDFLKSSFSFTSELIRLYPKLQRIDGERELTRGVSIVDLTGHTPGHIGVRIEDGDASLTLVSDMLFHPSMHPASSDIGIAFEQDPAAAKAMRERFFAKAAEDGGLIAATHMPFPGLGRIVRDGGKFQWFPADWAHQG